MTPEEEQLLLLQQRANNGDKEAATMLALMSDRPEATPDPRIGIQKRAQGAYALPEIDIDQQRANIATDTAEGALLGAAEHEKKDLWTGRGLIGAPFAGLMNMRKSVDQKKKDRQQGHTNRLRRAREAERLEKEQLAGRQGDIAALGTTESLNSQERGQDFTVDRYEQKREDTQADRDEERIYKAKLLEDSNARADRLRPSGTQITDYDDSKGSLDTIGDMNNRRSSLSEKDRDLYGAAMRDIGTSLAPAWSKGIVSEKAYGGSSAVQRLRAQERKSMAEFRRLISGKQVTGPEFLREIDWSPTAAGLSLDERQRRWDIMADETLGAVTRYEDTFSDYVGRPYESKSNNAESDRLDKEIEDLERQLRGG